MTDTDYLLSAPANAERLVEAVVQLDQGSSRSCPSAALRDRPDSAEALQRAYRTKRRLWAYRIHRPYSEDLDKPDPGALALADEENG